MKYLGPAIAILFAFAVAFPPVADVADVESLLRFSVLGGAERETASGDHRETGARPHGMGSGEIMGVLPLSPHFGFQGSFNYTGGDGSRFGTNVGAIYGWPEGKSGLFFAYQHRTTAGGDHHDYLWVRPALALYFPDVNVNLWYSQPLTETQRSGHTGDNRPLSIPVNQLQGTASYFPPLAIMGQKEALELTFGVQVNSFAGMDSEKLKIGVGPVFGIAMMPIKNLEVALLRGTIDNRSRYKFDTGIHYYFGTTATTLKEYRRKYLEPTNLPGTAGTWTHEP
ncbi:MAG TPA: hypothetical protein VGL11_21585 [Candidatus Binatia bacterium]|jgi:hypothetical protein